MSQDQIQLPEPVGTVAPRPDVVDWFSYEPEIGTELHEAATVRRLIAEAVAAEREACAVVCDSMPYRAASAGKAAQVIRARGMAAKSAGELPPADSSPQVPAPERLHPLHDPRPNAGLVSGGVPQRVPPTGMEHQGNDASPGHKFNGGGPAGGTGVSGGLEAGRSGDGGVAEGVNHGSSS